MKLNNTGTWKSLFGCSLTLKGGSGMLLSWFRVRSGMLLSEVLLDWHLIFASKTLPFTRRQKRCRYCVPVKSTVFYSSSLTVPFSVPFLWAKSMQPIHPNMTPLSPDCLASSNRHVVIDVIGPTQDGSLSHKVVLVG